MENKETNKKFDHLINQLKSESLTDAEKVYIKNVIFNSIDTNAVRSTEEERHISVGIKRSILTQIIFKRMPVFLAIALLFSGGVSFAAEGALPGDLLYPVKVGVNENVGQVLAFSTEAKAKYEAKIANKRVIEAERLVDEGKMTPERADELNARFEIRAEKARERFSKLEESMPGVAIEANVNFQARLKARINAMEDIAERNGDKSKKAEAARWIVDINNENTKLDKLRLNMEERIKLDTLDGLKERAEGKLKATENKIAETVRFVEPRKDSVSAEVYTEAEVRITLANNTVAEGKVKLEAGANGDAFVLFSKAFSIAIEAKEIVKDIDERNRRIGDDDQGQAEDVETDNENEASANVSAGVNVNANSNSTKTRGNAEVKVKIGL